MPSDPVYKTKRWKRLRAAVLRRDLYTCVLPGCGQPASVVDHIAARRAEALNILRSLCKPAGKDVRSLTMG